LRRELRALAHAAKAQVVDLRVVLGRRPEARAAVGAERLRAPVAARGSLHVDLRLAAQLEARGRDLDVRDIGRAGKVLAVRAVADAGLRRIGLRFVADLA